MTGGLGSDKFDLDIFPSRPALERGFPREEWTESQRERSVREAIRVYSHPMNQRKKGKKLIGFYASPEEKEALEKQAKARGISVSELLRRFARGSLILLVFGFVT